MHIDRLAILTKGLSPRMCIGSISQERPPPARFGVDIPSLNICPSNPFMELTGILKHEYYQLYNLRDFFFAFNCKSVLANHMSSGEVSPKKPSNRGRNLFRSFCIAPVVCFTCCTQPCTRAVKGRKRPTWNRKLELAIATLRSAARSIPRDTKSLRFWVDRPIPDIILPKAALRQKEKLKFGNGQQIVCDWVWPRHICQDMHISPRSRKVRNITSESFLKWGSNYPVVLYLHGGAFCLCNSATHRGLVYSLSLAGDMVMFVPNYRRPPEASVIEAVDDCFHAYMHLVQNVGIAASRIAIMGDSAGGALTVLTLCRIRDEGSPVPSCAALLSPWVELDDPMFEKHAAMSSMPEFDYLPYDAIVLFASESIGSGDSQDPRINPMTANLTGLPPLLMHAGELEVLRDQIERFHKKAREANVVAEFSQLEDMVHVGHMFSAFSSVARNAIKDICQFVNSHVVVPA